MLDYVTRKISWNERRARKKTLSSNRSKGFRKLDEVWFIWILNRFTLSLKFKQNSFKRAVHIFQNNYINIYWSKFVWKFCRVYVTRQWEHPVYSAWACGRKYILLLLVACCCCCPSTIILAWNTKRFLVGI